MESGVSDTGRQTFLECVTELFSDFEKRLEMVEHEVSMRPVLLLDHSYTVLLERTWHK
ncbi:MAG: hypothetical protein ACOH1R_12275 [Luteimonas sp.]